MHFRTFRQFLSDFSIKKWNGRRQVHRDVKDRLFRFLFTQDREALEQAIQHCIERGILSKMFKKKRAQVMGMILEEFDQDKYERTIREDGREEGIEIGERRGEERANRLAKALIEQNRIGDWERSTSDPEYRETLYREFQI